MRPAHSPMKKNKKAEERTRTEEDCSEDQSEDASEASDESGESPTPPVKARPPPRMPDSTESQVLPTNDPYFSPGPSADHKKKAPVQQVNSILQAKGRVLAAAAAAEPEAPSHRRWQAHRCW